MYNQRNLPPIETVLEMEPEELAPFVLKDLSGQERINRYNYTLPNGTVIQSHGNKIDEQVREHLMEAWMWLEREGFVAPKPGQQDTWSYVTARGEKVLAEQDFSRYASANLLPSDSLDPILVRKVKPEFIRGDYELAVFSAFKEVEVRVRTKGGFTATDLGVDLMRKAFKPKTGPLTDKAAPAGEQQAMMDLFAGAIGTHKNPSSHRYVEFQDAKEVADAIHLANHLLRIVDRAE
jgi:uncharacterized protein (TIGR02391 family)